MRRALAIAGLAVAAVTAVAAVLASMPVRSAAPVTVYAASSLRDAFGVIDRAPRYSFAGSGALRLQIEKGAPADVFASASPKEAQALYRARRCGRPTTFATNRLVLLVPEGNPERIRSVYALRKGRRRLAIGAAGVPAGDYARLALAKLGLSSILTTNRVSQEPNVASLTAKVANRSAAAGFAYVTDGAAARGRVDNVAIPADRQPPIRYQICAVRRRGADAEGARAYVAGVLSPRGRAALRRHGFGIP